MTVSTPSVIQTAVRAGSRRFRGGPDRLASTAARPTALHRLRRLVAGLGGAAVTAALLAACSTPPVGPDYRQPPEAAASQPHAALPFEQASTPGGGSPVFAAQPLPDHWWRLYQDDRLDAIVQQALAHNTDLRVALAHLESAQARIDEAEGGTRPTASVSGGPSYGHVSGLSELQPGYVPPNAYHYSAGAGLSYQVDLFGQIRRGIEAAQAGGQAAQAAVDLARVNVAAATTRAYLDICSANLRLASARRSLALQQEALGVNEQQQQAGRAASIDVSRARSQLGQLEAALPPLRAQRQGALYRLATLSGRLPQDFPREVQDCAAPPAIASQIPVGDGAQLLRRRPDIRQAERQLAEATARIGVATADLYPKITLGLSASSAGLASGFGRGDTFSWSLGPLVSWTLPNTGVAQARIAQSEAGTRAALATFDGTVLNALRETETALNAYAQELDRRAALQAARDQAAEVADQARALYRGGRSGYLDALDADRGLATAQAALAASDAQLADDQVTLFLALGGGWQP
ncbi:TolC family protein [Comamonadaceae bacterium PP-2]